MRHHLRKLISVLLVLTMIVIPLSITAQAAGNPFTDVKDTAWYKKAVDYVYEHKMFSGVGNNKFAPNATMTRSMFVTVLSNISNEGPRNEKTQHFADVDPKAWYFQAVEWAAKYSVVAGTGKFKFSPDDKITREQMATMLYRYALATGNVGESGASKAIGKYTDGNKVSDYAVKAMVWAVENKIIVGRSSTELAPKEDATRAEAAQIFMNASKLFKTTKIIVPEVKLEVPDKIDITMALMSQDEKIGQLFLARYPNDKTAKTEISTYHPGGYVFFEKDFKNKNKTQVQSMTGSVQNLAKVPMFTAVDEEGGTVVRVSSNKQLSDSKFQSIRDVYNMGGLDALTHDTQAKDKLLKSLGLNLNLGPVCDVTTDKSAFMFARSLGDTPEKTATAISHIVNLMNNDKMSCALKHFPGYGNNKDTHKESATDNRSLDTLKKNDLVVFQKAIDSKAPSVMMSHMIVPSIEKNIPVSLSPKAHKLLRNDMKFEGVIMTDDLSMGAVTEYTQQDAAAKAFRAGNDMIITSNLKADFESIKNAVETKQISMDNINKSVRRILEWKLDKGLIK